MLFDGIKLVEGSELQNLTVDSGTSFPIIATEGELFYRTDGANEALYVYSGSGWIRIQDQNSALSFTPVNKAGDTMTGLLTLSGNPVSNLHAATKQYVDNYQHTWDSITGKPTTIEEYNISNAQPLDSDLTAISSLSTFGLLTRTGVGAMTTRAMTGTAGRIVVTNGDGIGGAPTFDLVPAGTAGTYAQVTTDSYGRVTSGSPTLGWSLLTNTPTTLAGYNISDAQPLDGDLSAIAAISATTGLLRKTAANTWSLDTNVYLTGNQTITFSGDISGSGTTSVTLTLPNINSNVGSFNTVTVNAKGQVTAASNFAYAPLASPALTGVPTAPTATAGTNTTQIATTEFVQAATNNLQGGTVAAADKWATPRNLSLTGDATATLSSVDGSVDKSATLTLATVNSNVGTFNNVTVNAKGLVTAASNVSYQPLDGDLTAIAAISATTGLLRKTAADTWSLDTTAYAPLASPALTGTPTAPTATAGTNTTQLATTAFVTSAVTAGAVTSAGKWTTARDLSLTGDATATLSSVDGSANVSAGITLATVNSNVGSFGIAASVPTFTVNGKGLITSASNTPIAIATSQVTSGTFADARIAQSNVTQHQASLSITESQLVDGAILARVAASETISGSWSFTNAITGVDPTVGTHLATKQYVDNLATGLDFKASVRVATTGNITLSGTQTIDGVAVIAGDRVLVKDQTTQTQNGIYVVSGSAWARATDADNTPGQEVTSGMYCFVEDGTTNADTGWVLTTNGTITLGTTNLVFAQFTGLGQITAGNGLQKSGSTISVATVSSARITTASNGIDLATVGDSGTGTFEKVTVDAYGRVTGTTPVVSADLTALLGTMASQNATAVAITGGNINNTVIGATTAAAGSFTTINATDITTSGTNGLILNGANGSARRVAVRTAGLNRWQMGGTGDVESTGNAGTNFAIQRYDDAGNIIDNTFTINRATGNATFTGTITAAGFSGTITGNSSTATKLATARTIAATGDGTWSVNFDGSANVSSALTLATVNSNVGSFGSTSAVPVITVNAKGLVTAVSTAALGTMATQNASAVAITGGTINGTSIGATTASTGSFTTINASNTISSAGAIFANGATQQYTSFNSALVINSTGNGTQYGIALKPATSTGNTNAITFLSSSSTYASATQMAAIQHLAGDAGMSLNGTWQLNGVAFSTMSTQAASNVAITGGAINGTPIGATTPSTGRFTVMSNSVSDAVGNSTSVTTTSATAVDSFVAATYRSAKYIAQISDSTSHEVAEFLIIHDGTNVHIMTYGNVFTGAASLGNFDASISGGTLTVTFTATAASSKTVRLHRTSIIT